MEDAPKRRSTKNRNISRQWLEENAHKSLAVQAKELGTSIVTLYKYYRRYGLVRTHRPVGKIVGKRMISPPRGGCEQCILAYGYQIYRICTICQMSKAPILCEFRPDKHVTV